MLVSKIFRQREACACSSSGEGTGLSAWTGELHTTQTANPNIEDRNQHVIGRFMVAILLVVLSGAIYDSGKQLRVHPASPKRQARAAVASASGWPLRLPCQDRHAISRQLKFPISAKHTGTKTDVAQGTSQVRAPVKPQKMSFFRAPIKLADLTKDCHPPCQNHSLAIFIRFPEDRPIRASEIANAVVLLDLSGLSDVEDEKAAGPQSLIDPAKQFRQFFRAILDVKQITQTFA